MAPTPAPPPPNNGMSIYDVCGSLVFGLICFIQVYWLSVWAALDEANIPRQHAQSRAESRTQREAMLVRRMHFAHCQQFAPSSALTCL